MSQPKFHTRAILERLAKTYCHGELVDVGSGRAKYKEIFEPFITKYVAVDDLSSDYQYRGHADRDTVHVVAPADKMPFPDDSFDTAICTKVIEHVENPFSVLKEIARIMKPGAYLILSSDWFTPVHHEPKDYWRFTEEGYRSLARAADLSVVEIISQGGLTTALQYIIWRSIELKGGKFGRKFYRAFAPIRTLGEYISGAIDTWLPNPNGIGHVVILKK